MNKEMTRAILDGRKVQTRRVIKVRTDIDRKEWIDTLAPDYSKYQKDETVWVREPARILSYYVQMDRSNIELEYQYLADGDICKLEDIPERFIEFGDTATMPRWIYKHQGIPNGCIKEMARIFLKVTNIRVER